MLRHPVHREVESEPERPVRAVWLVTWSLALAIFINVLPTQASVTHMLTWTHLFWWWLIVKAAFLAITLLPLGVFFYMNGRRGLRDAFPEVAILGVIVGLRIVVDAATWCREIWGT